MQDDDTRQVAQDIEDGTYYSKAHHWYSEIFHLPIADRSYYIVVIMLAMINVYLAVNSFLAVFPIKPGIPFVTYSEDVWEDLPHIYHIASDGKEDKNVAVMKYFIRSYVINRESYDWKLLERRDSNIHSQSTTGVYKEYQDAMNAANAYSPYRLYTDRAKRSLKILSLSYSNDAKAMHAQVVFDETVNMLGDGEQVGDTRKFRAVMTFKYTPFDVDQSIVDKNWVAHLMSSLGVLGLTKNAVRASGDKRRVIPMTFVVSDYHVRELIE